MTRQNFNNYFYSLLNNPQLVRGIKWTYNLIFKNPIRMLFAHRVIDSQDPLFDYYKYEHLTIEEFKKRIAFMLKNYDFIFLDEAIGHITKKKIPANCLVLTFDDGYKDIFTNAFPLLKQYRIPTTIFLATDYIGTGRVLWHDVLTYAMAQTQQKKLKIPQLGTFDLSNKEQKIKSLIAIKYKIKFLSHQEKENLLSWIYQILQFDPTCLKDLDLMMSWDEVAQMQKSGLISFQSHSASHAILTQIPIEEAEKEMLRSKAAIEERIGRQVNILSYPNAWYNEELKSVLKKLGFIAACSCHRHLKQKTIDQVSGAGNSINACLFALERDGFDPEPFNRWATWMCGLFEIARLFKIRC